MALGKNRSRIYTKGPGKCEVRRVEPTEATAFESVGYIDSTAFNDEYAVEDFHDETGDLVNVVERSRTVSGVIQLMQTAKDELDLVSGAAQKVYSLRSSGLIGTGAWVYHCIDYANINPSIPLNYEVGKRLLPLQFKALVDKAQSYVVPPYYRIHADAEIRTENLVLWVEPRIDLNTGTVMILDVSGWQNHGTVYAAADVATIWGQTDILRFDGTNDYVDFGDNCDLDADDDFLIEVWARIPAADGTAQEILSKKNAADAIAGFSVVRNASNVIVVELADGTDHPEVTGSGTMLQNVWKHIAVHGDRDGNAQIYLNGAADGSPVDISAVGDMGNAISLYIARLGSAYGQVDVGGVRLYNFGASGLPSDIATIVDRHYDAQKAIYGLT